jgi:Leucine-rich repeat (LRR) protein
MLSIKDLELIQSYTSLKSLSLRDCMSLCDLGAISGLTSITSLKLTGCHSLSDLWPIARLTSLTSLEISGYDSLFDLTDLGPLSGLNRLTTLEIRYCSSLRDLSPLSGLSSLTSLDLSSCESLSDLRPLSGLTSLTSLNLSRCASLSDLVPISGLTSLMSLDLSWCDCLSDLGAISGLNALVELNLRRCELLSNLGQFCGLSSLTSLNLSWCSSLKELGALSGLTSLTSLNLSQCAALNDLGEISRLNSLTSLDLSWCDCLSDLGAISGLTSITSLDLSSCQSLSDLRPLSGLTSLTSLNLSSCKSLSDLRPLSGLIYLTNLELAGIDRLKSLEPLRNLKKLVNLDTSFYPGVVAELMAWNAASAKNAAFIIQNAWNWGSEAEKYGPEDREDQEKLVRSLGMAFSLLDEHEEIIPEYEAFLDAHPEFGIAPWKAWFLGTKENWGFELLKKRIERIPLPQMFPSAIGGACAAMPTLDDPAEEVQWAREWLANLENERSGNAKELLPVAPEICLAYARLGEMEALGRWLERLTDPSDPGALDELQFSLARWRLSSGDLKKARSHISAIHSPTARDPILAELVLAELAADPDTASEDLLLVQGTQTRGDLAKKLATEPTFTNSESRLHRLLVAAGENPTALAELITLLGASVPSEIVNRLSVQLGLPQAELQQWRITQLETLLKQLQTIAKI